MSVVCEEVLACVSSHPTCGTSSQFFGDVAGLTVPNSCWDLSRFRFIFSSSLPTFLLDQAVLMYHFKFSSCCTTLVNPLQLLQSCKAFFFENTVTTRLVSPFPLFTFTFLFSLKSLPLLLECCTFLKFRSYFTNNISEVPPPVWLLCIVVCCIVLSPAVSFVGSSTGLVLLAKLLQLFFVLIRSSL
eukprot:TRINITY_DN67996_c2_g2_i1.p1 TRINITY_DN67996_c2_g2~~TRINITY_DN67996_c2_g2_i1.p1  ORF type:complete len:186 (-),score=19.68 TRINITY_DN67996_c2_g2_i1:268-825(-)